MKYIKHITEDLDDDIMDLGVEFGITFRWIIPTKEEVMSEEKYKGLQKRTFDFFAPILKKEGFVIQASNTNRGIMDIEAEYNGFEVIFSADHSRSTFTHKQHGLPISMAIDQQTDSPLIERSIDNFYINPKQGRYIGPIARRVSPENLANIFYNDFIRYLRFLKSAIDSSKLTPRKRDYYGLKLDRRLKEVIDQIKEDFDEFGKENEGSLDIQIGQDLGSRIRTYYDNLKEYSNERDYLQPIKDDDGNLLVGHYDVTEGIGGVDAELVGIEVYDPTGKNKIGALSTEAAELRFEYKNL